METSPRPTWWWKTPKLERATSAIGCNAITSVEMGSDPLLSWRCILCLRIGLWVLAGALGLGRHVDERLTLSSEAVRHWKIGKNDASSARSALRAAYRKARRAYRLAARQGSDSNWHECRKQTKYLYYQLQFAKVLGFRPPGATARARALGALLGREQDLALLRSALRCGGGNRNATNRALLKYIDLRCARLCSKASAAGSRLYRRSARAFAESLRATAGRRR